MKKIKSIYGLLAAGILLFASCDINEEPTFNDKDAFVAFTNSTMSIAENKGTLEIPVLLTSLSGITTTVDFEIVAGNNTTAVEGTHYTVTNSSHTLSFTKEEPIQYIKLSIIDNDGYGGDQKIEFALKDPNGVSLGASKGCVVTIEDDEHPLSFILGSFSCVGESNFGGGLDWTLTIEKDADDIYKVWIGNLVPGGSSVKVYGTVNEEKTELRIPVGQEIAKSASYPQIILEGFYGPDGDEDIPTGKYITGDIASDGTITIQDLFGSHVYSDEAGTSAGWYEIVLANSVWKK